MDPSSELINYMPSVGYACPADCATTHTILRDKKYFSTFTLTQSNVHTISSPIDLIKGSGRATIKVLKSHIPAVNAPAHIEIPIGDSGNAIASTSKPRLKRKTDRI